MAVHPGPRPPGFTYDPSTARHLATVAEQLADAAEQLARQARAGRGEVESRPFAGRTATEARDRHEQLDDDLRLLADAARDQVDQLHREIEQGLAREAAAVAARQRWQDELRAWRDAS